MVAVRATLCPSAVAEGKTLAEPRNRYSTVSLILHWVIALAVVAQVALIMAHDATEGPLSREFVQMH